MNLGAPEGKAFSAPLVAIVVIVFMIMNQKRVLKSVVNVNVTNITFNI
jgi:hypothetical protein